MEDTSEIEEIDNRDFLPEILDKIFNNLNAQDLSKISTVNKLWNEAATRVLTKRGPERTIIPASNVDIYNSINVKPYVALLLVDSDKHKQLAALKKYKDYFPHYLAVVGMHYVTMDEKLITFDLGLSKGGILSLLIPQYRDLKVRATYNQHLGDRTRDMDFLNHFLPEDSQSKATFLLFGRDYFNNSHLFELLKKSMEERQQKFSLWGGAFDTAPYAAVNCQIDESIEEEFEEFKYDYSVKYNGIFAMSIAGSSLESSSVVISCLAKKYEFDKKLLDFRDQLRFKRHSIGLVCGPDQVIAFSQAEMSNIYTNYKELMNVVKENFPGSTIYWDVL